MSTTYSRMFARMLSQIPDAATRVDLRDRFERECQRNAWLSYAGDGSYNAQAERLALESVKRFLPPLPSAPAPTAPPVPPAPPPTS